MRFAKKSSKSCCHKGRFCFLLILFFLKDGGAEFVFAEDSHKKRGWGERMFSSIGTSYMAGSSDLYCILWDKTSYAVKHSL